MDRINSFSPERLQRILRSTPGDRRHCELRTPRKSRLGRREASSNSDIADRDRVFNPRDVLREDNTFLDPPDPSQEEAQQFRQEDQEMAEN